MKKTKLYILTYVSRTLESVSDAGTRVVTALAGVTLPTLVANTGAAIAVAMTRAYRVVATIARKVVALAVLAPDHLLNNFFIYDYNNNCFFFVKVDTKQSLK